jgi:thioredoxin reductase
MENVGQPVPGQARPLRYVVVGGSPVGLCAAIALSRLGAEVSRAQPGPGDRWPRHHRVASAAGMAGGSRRPASRITLGMKSA